MSYDYEEQVYGSVHLIRVLVRAVHCVQQEILCTNRFGLCKCEVRMNHARIMQETIHIIVHVSNVKLNWYMRVIQQEPTWYMQIGVCITTARTIFGSCT